VRDAVLSKLYNDAAEKGIVVAAIWGFEKVGYALLKERSCVSV
jgi:hypothetical protein